MGLSMAISGYPGDDAILATPPAPYNPMVTNTDGRTRLRRELGWDLSRTLVLITIGQSLTANYVGGERQVGSGSLIQINLLDGALYVAQDPLLGVDQFDPVNCSNFGIPLGRLLLATGRWDRFILLPIGVGSTPVQAWSADGVFNSRIGVAAKRLRDLGLTADAVLWQQGTSNAGYTPADEYALYLRQVITTHRAVGLTCPFFVAQDSWISGGLDTMLRKGQLACVDKAAGVYRGPDIDLVTERRDVAHLTQAGGQHQAVLWRDAILPVLTA